MGEWAGLAVILFGAGGTLWALRAVLRNKLVTIASHEEHMRSWADRVQALEKRLAEQEESHRQERARDTAREEARVAELRAGYESRIADRDARIREQNAELDRAWSAYTVTDEAYQQVTSGRIHQYGAALRTMASVLRASPLADAAQIDTTTAGDDGGTAPDG